MGSFISVDINSNASVIAYIREDFSELREVVVVSHSPGTK